MSPREAHASDATVTGHSINQVPMVRRKVFMKYHLLSMRNCCNRSGDKALAERLELPQTHFQLDYVRPEQLLLRVVVRGLVMWDEVQPTEEWIDSQVTLLLTVALTLTTCRHVLGTTKLFLDLTSLHICGACGRCSPCALRLYES